MGLLAALALLGTGAGGGGGRIPGGHPLAEDIPNPSKGFWGMGLTRRKGDKSIIRVLGAQPCLAAGRPHPEPAAHNEVR